MQYRGGGRRGETEDWGGGGNYRWWRDRGRGKDMRKRREKDRRKRLEFLENPVTTNIYLEQSIHQSWTVFNPE